MFISTVLYHVGRGAAVFCDTDRPSFYVQIINKDFLQNKANANILRTNTIKAMRGVIYDRNGIPLAISTPIMKIVIDPRDYFDNKNSMMKPCWHYRKSRIAVN